MISGIKDIISRYNTFIFDMDGVIWNQTTPIKSAINAIQTLLSQSKNVVFFTNSSGKNRSELHSKLNSFGINVPITQVYSSSYLTALYCKQKLNVKKVYVITLPGTCEEMTKQAIPYTHSIIHDNEEPTQDLNIDSDIDTLIVGFDDKFNYRKIEYSLAYLNNGATFIGTNIDRTYVVNDHIVSAGGTMVKAIEYASGKEAIIIGKPNRRGYDLIKEEQKIEDDSKVVMIGDNVETDIEFAKNSGIDSVLVMTGVCKDDKLGVNATYIAKEL